jgi:hypothetical protein
MPIGVRGEEVLLKPDGRVKVEVDGQWHPEHVAAKGKDKTRRGREMERRRKEEEREEVDPEKVAQDEAWTAYAYAREVHVRNGRKARTVSDLVETDSADSRHSTTSAWLSRSTRTRSNVSSKLRTDNAGEYAGNSLR